MEDAAFINITLLFQVVKESGRRTDGAEQRKGLTLPLFYEIAWSLGSLFETDKKRLVRKTSPILSKQTISAVKFFATRQ
jgi:hypothetical protein